MVIFDHAGMTYLPLPSPERSGLCERLARDDLKHAGNRVFGTDGSFNFPVHRDVRHVPRDSQHS